MATDYHEALDEAAARMLGSINLREFSKTHLEAFDLMVPRLIKERIIPELLGEPCASSIATTVRRLIQHKWDLVSPTGFFGSDKEKARQEVGRLFDNLVVDVVKAMETFRARGEGVAKAPRL